MKEITVKIRVPDAIDPFTLLDVMKDDFFYSNRDTEDFGPYMEEIYFEVVTADATQS
jgi:hypothetical protein